MPDGKDWFYVFFVGGRSSACCDGRIAEIGRWSVRGCVPTQERGNDETGTMKRGSKIDRQVIRLEFLLYLNHRGLSGWASPGNFYRFPVWLRKRCMKNCR